MRYPMKTHHCSNCGADVWPNHEFVPRSAHITMWLLGFVTCGFTWLGMPIMWVMCLIPTCPHCRYPVSRIPPETELTLDN